MIVVAAAGSVLLTGAAPLAATALPVPQRGIRAVTPAPGDAVTIPDSRLAAVLNQRLGAPVGSPITAAQLETLTDLGNPRGLSSLGITDLTGLEHATNLTKLNIWGNAVTDLSPLAGLTKLTSLQAYSNRITDLTPLAGMTALTTLNLYDNDIADLTPLSGLTRLTDLRVHSNQISDISPLEGMSQLSYLVIADNQISDLEPLRELTTLNNLYAYGNMITSVAPLAGLTRLQLLAVADNHIVDVTPLAGLTALSNLSLRNNHIADLSSLSALSPAEHYYSGQYDVAAGSLYVPLDATTFTHPATGLLNTDATAVTALTAAGYTVADGLVTWAPIADSQTSLPIRFEGAGSFDGSGAYTIVPAVFTNGATDDGVVGTDYAFTFTTTTGFRAAYALTAGEVPGLTLDADTGILSGTPTQAGRYDLTVTATDAYGNPLAHDYTVVITAAAVVVPPVEPGDSEQVDPAPVVDDRAPAETALAGDVLARTGADSLLPLGAAAGALLLGGLVVLRVARRRTRVRIR